jgi:hypothetical protein
MKGLFRRLSGDHAEHERDRETLIATLAEDELTARGFLAEASNHTLLVQVGERTQGIHAVYKPREGERPLWDFPSGTLCQREAAAFVVSEHLGWDIVPPTVLRDGPMGPGSVQLFIPHDPEQHYFHLVQDPALHAVLAQLAVFDLLVNNADRKGSHVLRGDEGEVFGIDHGLTFHREPKLRTVIWELGGAPIEPAWRDALRRLAGDLDTDEDVRRQLEALLSIQEVEMLCARAAALAGEEALPDVDERRRPYPWPPL